MGIAQAGHSVCEHNCRLNPRLNNSLMYFKMRQAIVS